MAFPTILIDSTDGAASDDNASGAGPATAITGSSATVNGGDPGTTIDLDGSPDLSGVATDGSAAIYFQGVGFRQITAVNDGADQVTVATAVSLSTGAAWAIGGVRATVFSASKSILLFQNAANNAAGDAKGGWTIRMLDGHAESANEIDIRSVGSLTNGPVTLEGESGAVTKPKITFNGTPGAGADVLVARANYWRFRDFEIDGVTRGSDGIEGGGGTQVSITGMLFTACLAGVRFGAGGTAWTVTNCEFDSCDDAIEAGQNGTIQLNHIHDSVGKGIFFTGNISGLTIERNVITGCGEEGIFLSNSRTDGFASLHVRHNRIDDCNEGIEIAGAPNPGMGGSSVAFNLISNSAATGLNFSNGSSSANAVKATGMLVDYNAFYNNLAHRNNVGAGDNDIELTASPYVGSGDYRLNSTANGGQTLRDDSVEVP